MEIANKTCPPALGQRHSQTRVALVRCKGVVPFIVNFTLSCTLSSFLLLAIAHSTRPVTEAVEQSGAECSRRGDGPHTARACMCTEEFAATDDRDR